MSFGIPAWHTSGSNWLFSARSPSQCFFAISIYAVIGIVLFVAAFACAGVEVIVMKRTAIVMKMVRSGWVIILFIWVFNYWNRVSLCLVVLLGGVGGKGLFGLPAAF